ncbi:MAG: hypothetical protein MMC33_003819 [Icmadophila ericetorum]|nr:hypothetical protein [Icmadophila ericetorum]
MSGRRPAPRPKRGGEEFARTRHNDSDGPSSKKPRFDIRNPSALVPDAPEEDAILEADEIGKRGQQTKRNAVNIDGYESDSSNEGFSARAEAKAREANKGKNGAAGSKNEENNDMFADLEEERFGDGDADEDLATEGKKGKKTVKFVDVDEIEGQVDHSKSGGHVSADFTLKPRGEPDRDVESSSESDVAEEDRAAVNGEVDEEIGAGGKKRHAPKLDAFNLRQEEEEGGFDDQMNYVRKARDPDAIHDTWLQGLSKKDMRRAKEAEERRDEERRRKLKEADAVLTSDILATLIPHLERGESVLEALARLGKGKEKKKPKWQQTKNKRKANGDEMDVDPEPAVKDPAEVKRRAAVEAITEAADQLLTRGQTEIYDAERELLMRQYARETGEQWVDPPKEEVPEEALDVAANGGEKKEWDYRWSDARDGGEAHGPYGGDMMVRWNDAGYFGEGVEFRRTGNGHEGGEWSRSVDFL